MHFTILADVHRNVVKAHDNSTHMHTNTSLRQLKTYLTMFTHAKLLLILLGLWTFVFEMFGACGVNLATLISLWLHICYECRRWIQIH